MERQELAEMLLELVEDETGEKYTHLDEQTNLRQGLKLDSLDTVSLVLHIENRLGIEIDGEELNDTLTVGSLLDLLESKVAGRAGRQAA
jgi:acyl carrier protein